MRTYSGRVTEIRLAPGGFLPEARILCPEGAIPAPGQYLVVRNPQERDAPLSLPVFLAGAAGQGFWAAPPFPTEWSPGTILELSGPLGHGFTIPASIRRLALAALGDTPARLLPLAAQAIAIDCAVTLFTDTPLPALPASMEVYPLAVLPEALSWPDLLAIDLPIEILPDLRSILGLSVAAYLPCLAQALVWTPMPCSGLAQCGACAVRAMRKSYLLACEDGPVIDLRRLEW